jgi:glycosyltransferase involved in cell wall biosynthesis
MRDVVSAKLGDSAVPIHVVPNWGDIEAIRPKRRGEVELLRELGLADRFVVQYSGNLGRTQGVELLIDVAELMRSTDEDVFFLIIGSGPTKDRLERAAAAKGLDNIRFLDRQPAEAFADSINACDLAVVMLQRGMAGLSAPSRLYNLLAAGRPLLVVAEPESQPARVVAEESLGWVVQPGDAHGAREAILAARRCVASREEMSARARSLAVDEYSYGSVCRRYTELYGAGRCR